MRARRWYVHVETGAPVKVDAHRVVRPQLLEQLSHHPRV
eukprot:COSAG02_NODE_41184_length_397_cov_0.822148_2_plen_38_part_01